jgi:hypothetical protein
VSRDWHDSDFDGFDRRKISPNGRKQERQKRRHETKHHLRDLKDMLNGGEDIYDAIDDLDDEEKTK